MANFWTDAVNEVFRLSADQIRPIAPGRGACYASDKITVSGERVGYMYREAPDFDADSGWRFFSGTETQDFVDNLDNIGIYDVNTLANYDNDIVAHLDAPEGASFVRDPTSGGFLPDAD